MIYGQWWFSVIYSKQLWLCSKSKPVQKKNKNKKNSEHAATVSILAELTLANSGQKVGTGSIVHQL